jgi:hypothetical protein
MKRRTTPVFIVCSPLPRVGKTLIAQLLVEFFATDRRPVAAFDLNPDGYTLAAQVPEQATVANILGTKGQMALFDQLIVADGTAKVLDVGYGCFEQFFAVMHDIGFVGEALQRGVMPVIMFMSEPDHRSSRAYAKLRDRFPEISFVPVFNAGTTAEARSRNSSKADFAGVPLHIPALSPGLRAAVAQVGFSSALAEYETADMRGELLTWVRRIFLQFREMELRLLLEDLKPALRLRA